MDVLGPGKGGVGGDGGPGIVIARRDEDPGPDGAQDLAEQLRRLPVDPVGVEEIPGQQQELAVVAHALLRQAADQLPLLLPPLGGLIRGQRREGAVQMQVSGMKNSYHDSISFLYGYSAPSARQG